jgi:hypothetical protein
MRTRAWLAALLVLAGALPWLASLLCADDCRVAFAWVCHQQPQRTLVLLGKPMVVCSRCAGIYAGLLLGGLLPWRPSTAQARNLTLGALAIHAIDWAAGWAGAPVIHGWRLLLGAALGWAATVWLLSAVETRDQALTDSSRVVKTE